MLLVTPTVVIPAVFKELTILTAAPVTQIAWPVRFETSAAISASFFITPQTTTIYVANGLTFHDALYAGPAGAMSIAPLLLVTTNIIPESIRTEIERSP